MHSDNESSTRATAPLLGTAEQRGVAGDPPQYNVDDNHHRHLEYRLYISHMLSTWNSRLFEFGAVLFLASIFPKTLLPMSVYALVRSLSAIALAHPVGGWIDRGHRLHVVRASIIGQRVPVALSCGILWLLERRLERLAASHVIGLLALLCVLAGAEKVAAMANTIAVERDWVVVTTEGDDAWRRGMLAEVAKSLDMNADHGTSNQCAPASHRFAMQALGPISYINDCHNIDAIRDWGNARNESGLSILRVHLHRKGVAISG